MSSEIDREAQHLVDDLKEVAQTHNLHEVWRDLVKEYKNHPGDVWSFLMKVSEDMQKEGVLPGLKLEGLDGKDVVFEDRTTKAQKEFDQHGHKVREIPASSTPEAPAPQPETHPEPTTSSAPEAPPPPSEARPETQPRVAPPTFERCPDGSVVTEATWPTAQGEIQGYHRQWGNGASVDYDQAGHTIGTDDGQGHTNRFHYSQNGQVDWLRGSDGATWIRTGQRQFQDNHGRSFFGDLQVDQMGVIHYQPDPIRDNQGRLHAFAPFVQIPKFDPQTHGLYAESPNYQPQPPYRFGEYSGSSR